MIISPSIASSDILNIEKEVKFGVEHFNQIHLDVEDGVAVNGISFGMKMCKRIKNISKEAYISLHLEVYKPLDYIDELEEIKPDILFIQTDHLNNKAEILQKFKKRGLRCGVSLSDRDLNTDNEEILKMSDEIMVLCAYLSDPEQIFRQDMADYAQSIARKFNKKVWIDGGISYDRYKELCKTHPDIYATVMGRGVFGNKEIYEKGYKQCMTK